MVQSPENVDGATLFFLISIYKKILFIYYSLKMNNEQWKAYRNDRIQKIRELKDEQVKHQDKRKKGKKGNSSNYVQKKKNFNCKNKKLQTKAAEKPTPGALLI